MPAHRLREDRAVSIGEYDVVGQDSDSEPEFVRHVGLCELERSEVRANHAEISLAHMGPPLVRGTMGAIIQTVGSAELTSDEVRQIGVFVDELESEYTAQRTRGKRQYVIPPHVHEPDETFPCRRFSCAGFVIEAYRDAGIDLLATIPQSLPAIALDTLALAYPDQAERLNDPQARAPFGLAGDGPWPVVLAGYVVNAFRRPPDEIRRVPYVPHVGDQYFPPRGDAG
jgi:hypothetical protein